MRHDNFQQYKKIPLWSNINIWSAIIQSVWNAMKGVRKQRIKENNFETGWTSHLYELPRFYCSFLVFKWSLWSGRNHLPKWYSSAHALGLSHSRSHALKGILGSPYYFRCAQCSNNFWCLRMSIARSVQCRRERKRSVY